MATSTTHIQTPQTSASEPVYITANIGPGPNSIAFLCVENGELYAIENKILRELLREEEDQKLQHVAEWLHRTRGIVITLSGAHHDIETYDSDQRGAEPTRACLFCGDGYRWSIRCSRNREGLV